MTDLDALSSYENGYEDGQEAEAAMHSAAINGLVAFARVVERDPNPDNVAHLLGLISELVSADQPDLFGGDA